MKKLIGILLVLVIVTFIPIIVAFVPNKERAIQNKPVSQVEMIAQAMQSVVRVIHPDYGEYAMSGFYIGNGVIVTVGHVSEMEGLEKVIFEDGSEYPVLKQIVHPDYDCGFLLIDDPNKPALEFDLAGVQRGDVVYTLGNPEKRSFVAAKGIVCGRTVVSCFGEIQLIIEDIARYSGTSGAVLLDVDGEIRGVHVGSVISNDYGVSICVEDILNALEHAGLEI